MPQAKEPAGRTGGCFTESGETKALGSPPTTRRHGSVTYSGLPVSGTVVTRPSRALPSVRQAPRGRQMPLPGCFVQTSYRCRARLAAKATQPRATRTDGAGHGHGCGALRRAAPFCLPSAGAWGGLSRNTRVGPGPTCLQAGSVPLTDVDVSPRPLDTLAVPRLSLQGLTSRHSPSLYLQDT